MSNQFHNPLREFSEKITQLSNEFPNYLNQKLRSFGFPLNDKRIELEKKETWIDWNSIPNHSSFYFDFENNESTVKSWLGNSELRTHSTVIMDFGYQAPISEIPSDIFFDFWYELVIIAGYESVIFTPGGQLVLEFVRHNYTLKSNFEIRPL